MANLHDDRKKEEEEFGGFEPGQDENDESFLLGEDSAYPAKLPDNFSDDESEAEPEEFDLGDDFKKELQQNIDKSKARREANSTEDDGIEPSGELAMPIGDDADTIVNLSDIDADKPSNYVSKSSNKKQEK